MSIFRINIVALGLVLATFVSWRLGEGAASVGGQSLVTGATITVLALSAFKGALIALEFMELRGAPALWRRAVMGWLFVVVGSMAIATLLLPR